MARVADLQVRLIGRTLQATGEILLRAEVLLLVTDACQDWHLLAFRADSGSEVTTMQAAVARQLDIPMPQAPTPGLRMRNAAGEESLEPVRAGAIKVRFFGMEEQLGVQERDAQASGFTACSADPHDFGPGRLDEFCDVFHFWSLHPGGAHFLFVDGSVHFMHYDSAPIMPQLATKAGGEVVQAP